MGDFEVLVAFCEILCGYFVDIWRGDVLRVRVQIVVQWAIVLVVDSGCSASSSHCKWLGLFVVFHSQV